MNETEQEYRFTEPNPIHLEGQFWSQGSFWFKLIYMTLCVAVGAIVIGGFLGRQFMPAIFATGDWFQDKYERLTEERRNIYGIDDLEVTILADGSGMVMLHDKSGEVSIPFSRQMVTWDQTPMLNTIDPEALIDRIQGKAVPDTLVDPSVSVWFSFSPGDTVYIDSVGKWSVR